MTRPKFGAEFDRAVQLHARVLQDALSEATADYWRRVAARFEDAAPRPGDWPGRATPEALRLARERCLETAAACRARAAVESSGQPIGPEVAELLGVASWV